MASLNELSKQLKSTESQLSAYDADLPSQIRAEIQKAYSPALERSLGVTRDMMGDYGERYFDATSMGPGMAGTTAKDLSPSQKLGVMGRELGTMAGNLQSQSKFSDYLGGQMTDMVSLAQQNAQLGKQGLADQYNRTWQQYQLATQLAEAEKDRALSRSLSGGSGGGFVYDPSNYMDGGQGGQGQATRPSQSQILDLTKQAANQLAKTRQQAWANKPAGASGSPNYTLNVGGNRERVGNIDDAHRYLTNYAAQYGVNLNPEWLWKQLGNTTGRVYSAVI